MKQLVSKDLKWVIQGQINPFYFNSIYFGQLQLQNQSILISFH